MRKKVVELFDQIVLETTFQLSSHLQPDQVTPDQNQRLNIIFKALKGNLIPKTVPTAWGGKINENALINYRNQLLTTAQKVPFYKESQDYLNRILDLYLKFLRQRILATCAMQFSVQNLPFAEFYILLCPKVIWPSAHPEKMRLQMDGYTIGAELSAIITKNVLFAKFIGSPPFFAPINGHFTMPGYETQTNEDTIFNNPDYHQRFLDYLSHPLLTNIADEYLSHQHLHGQPFADFLNDDPDLKVMIPKLKSPIDEENLPFKRSIIGLIQRFKKKSSVLMYDEEYLSYVGIMKSISTICHLGAACFEFPGTRIIKRIAVIPKFTALAQVDDQKMVDGDNSKEENPTDITPSTSSTSPRFQTWSQKALDNLAKKRGIINLPSWTEEELQDLAVQRGLIKLPEWTQEDLDKLLKEYAAKQEEPQWEEDPNLRPCPQCGYLLQPDWKECPICTEKLQNQNSNISIHILDDNPKTVESQDQILNEQDKSLESNKNETPPQKIDSSEIVDKKMTKK